MISERLLQDLEDFHGHLGPYLVAGARMGLIANQLLSPDKLVKYCIVRCSRPPMSCLIDGIQFTSGCTYGTARIVATSEEIPEAIFSHEDRELCIKLKKPFKFQGEGLHELQEYVYAFLKKPDSDVFDLRANFALPEQ
ncbi:MAG: FmdE family protein [Promethearchaeota archaeon]